jgi:hypothetical protein
MQLLLNLYRIYFSFILVIALLMKVFSRALASVPEGSPSPNHGWCVIACVVIIYGLSDSSTFDDWGTSMDFIYQCMRPSMLLYILLMYFNLTSVACLLRI